MEGANDDLISAVDEVPVSLLESAVLRCLELGMDNDLILSAYGEEASRFLPQGDGDAG